jgi:hypothetical protein
LSDVGFKGNLRIHAIEDKFIPSSTVEAALEKNGLDKDAILRSL